MPLAINNKIIILNNIKNDSDNGDGNGQFSEPEGIDVDNSGHVYVADIGNNRVQVFGEEA